MQFIAANNAVTTTAGAIAPTDTVVPLAVGSGDLFPLPVVGESYYVATLSNAQGTLREIVQVTAMSGDAATVVRAQEGTSAQSWPLGSLFKNLLTKEQAQGYVQRLPVYASQDFGGGGGSQTLDLSDKFVFPTPSVVIEMTAAANTVLQDIVGAALKTVVTLVMAVGSHPVSIPFNTPPFFLSNTAGPVGWPGVPLSAITLLYIAASGTYRWVELGRTWRV